MYGLIKKEFFMIKQNTKILIFMFVVFFGMSILNKSDMTFIFPFMAVMISISAFSYDTFNKWDAYAVTLPSGRKNIVKAKYISTLGFVILSFIVSLISLEIMRIGGINIAVSSLEDLIGCLFAVFFIISIMYPIMYKFGVEKGRLAFFIVTIAVTGIAVLISENISFSIPKSIIDFCQDYYKIFLPIITCLVVYISYKISARFYAQKEF